MVNNYRRLFPSYQRVRELIQSGQLGKLRRINNLDGTQFAWNSASSFYLRDPQTRGVLLDRGAHTIDVLCWWLGDTPRVVAAHGDVFNGVEGLMDVHLASDTQHSDQVQSFLSFGQLLYDRRGCGHDLGKTVRLRPISAATRWTSGTD